MLVSNMRDGVRFIVGMISGVNEGSLTTGWIMGCSDQYNIKGFLYPNEADRRKAIGRVSG